MTQVEGVWGLIDVNFHMLGIFLKEDPETEDQAQIDGIQSISM